MSPEIHPDSITGVFVFPAGLRRGTLHWNPENGLIGGFSVAKSAAKTSESILIFPGFIDLHIHAREDTTGRDNYKEDFISVSRAALHGGVVHVADMPNNPVPPVDEASYAAKEKLLAKADIGITLYAGVGPETSPLQREVPYKAYMGPSIGELFFADQDQLDKALSRYPGRYVSFHCEDPEILSAHKHESLHELRRPPAAEIVSTRFAIAMIRKYKLHGKLCHYSTREGLALINAARAEGVDVTCEVTPHHLFFDESHLTPSSRPWLQMNPPLRSKADREHLLQALKDGRIDYLATDHAPHTCAEKEKGISGVPHLDTYGAFVAWLIRSRGFAPQDVLPFCCENPARFLKPFLSKSYGLGLGRLETGYRADLTVLDLSRPWTPTRADLKTKCAWSPFENIALPGRVSATIIAGKMHRQDGARLV